MSFADPAHGADEHKIVIGGKNFTESFILAELFTQLIEARTDLHVELKVGLGGTLICFEALKKGDIDIYPEYTGTALTALMNREVINDPETVYTVVNDYFRKKGLIFLNPLGFNNTYTLTMRRKMAEELGIETISQLKPYAGNMKFCCTQEFMERPDGYKNLIKLYDLNFKSAKAMDPGLTYLAVRAGKADVIDGFSTDGRISVFNLVILEDDRHFFPPYYAAPFVRLDTIERHPEIKEILNELGGAISDKDMQTLNYQVDQKGARSSTVARNYLIEKGLIKGTIQETRGGKGFWGIVGKRKVEIGLLTLQHLKLTAIAVILAILIAVPLGIIMTRFGSLSGPIMYMVNIIQTIPSLALLGFLVPIYGIGEKPAIIALFLYALLPIVSNTHTGIRQVDGAMIEAAKGMGMKDMQILFKVELPIALTVIMAGVRTSTVINIGTATLAAFIGAGGLGDLILRGIALSNNSLILAGAIPAAILAIGADKLLKIIEDTLRPKGVK